MSKLATLKEMQADGWKLRTINKVKCLVLETEQETMICQWNERGYFYAVDLLAVVNKIGQPAKIHEINGQVITIEYHK